MADVISGANVVVTEGQGAGDGLDVLAAILAGLFWTVPGTIVEGEDAESTTTVAATSGFAATDSGIVVGGDDASDTSGAVSLASADLGAAALGALEALDSGVIDIAGLLSADWVAIDADRPSPWSADAGAPAPVWTGALEARFDSIPAHHETWDSGNDLTVAATLPDDGLVYGRAGTVDVADTQPVPNWLDLFPVDDNAGIPDSPVVTTPTITAEPKPIGLWAEVKHDFNLWNIYSGSAKSQTIDGFHAGTDKIVLTGWQTLPPVVISDDPSATTAAATLLFDKTTGVLTFDTNGYGAGGEIEIAVLNGVTNLSVSDFLLV